MRALKAIPNRDPQRRAIALVRVSKERDGMTSPEVQAHAIEELARQHNLKIVDWIEGLDESGSQRRSAWWARLDQSIARIENGEADDIVVWKYSRTGRQRLKWAILLDRMDACAGRILSATEPIDTANAGGRFARGMLGEVNAYQADLIGETWKEAHARRVRSGRPANGKPRFGYAYTREGGFTPDPISGPILREAYVRYIGGESVYSLVAWMNDGPTNPVTGYGGASDGLWSDRTLRRVLDSGFGAGKLNVNVGTAKDPRYEHAEGTHEPVISDDEWADYLEARARRRVYRRTERSEYLLSGLLRCACGSSMTAGQFGANRAPKYRCKAGKEKRAHSGGYVTASFVEDHVYQWLVDRQEKARAARDAAKVEARPRPVVDPTAAIRAEITRTIAAIDRTTSRAIELEIPRDAYQRQLAPLTAKLEALEAEERALDARQRKPLVALTVDVITDWHDLEIPQRRELLRAVIDHVIVTPGHPRATFEVIPRD